MVLKRLYLPFVSLLASMAVYGQQDSIKHNHPLKKRASAYDTNAIYFNKWKVNFNADIGINILDVFITGTPAESNFNATPGIFGILNSAYTVTPPAFYNFTASYGFTAKSALGINATFCEAFINPAIPSQNYKPGNISMFTVGARYMHCIRSWRFFYYGGQASIAFLATNFDTNTFTDKPNSAVPSIQPMVSWFLGGRFPIAKKLWFHFEVQEGVSLYTGLNNTSFNHSANNIFVYESLGLNYCFDTRKKTTKK
jgi:hypothetical protein